MSAIWYENPIPAYWGVIPGLSFYDQAIIEVPAPVKYQVAQEFKHRIELQFGPDWHYYICKQAHEVYLSKRPWWVTVA